MSNVQDVAKLTVSPSQAMSCILKAIKAKKVPMLHGSPAIGKSSIIHQIAEQFNLCVIDMRLGQTEPTDMQGYPYSDMVRMKSGYLPIEEFPIEGDPLPVKTWNFRKGDRLNDGSIALEDSPATYYAGWLLFFDELTSAKEETQAAAYKVILDRKVGMKNIHKNVAMVAAGNLETDNAVVYPMSTALQTRMIHLVLQLSVKEWLSWAIGTKKADHRITDYIAWKPDNLYNFDPDHSDLTYASPRTWEFTEDVLRVCNGDVKDADFLSLASGCVTEGVTREFLMFCDIYAQLPKMADIMMSPQTVPMPGEPSILFALSGSLGNHATTSNIDKLLPFILRMDVEFQVVTLRYIIKRDKQLKHHAEIAKWVVNHGALLF